MIRPLFAWDNSAMADDHADCMSVGRFDDDAVSFRACSPIAT
jgi:hypothetical protein